MAYFAHMRQKYAYWFLWTFQLYTNWILQVRIGHFAEAQILQHLGVDMIDESEVLAPADDEHHIDKTTGFQVIPL